ncbi:MAG: MATE family efflux transporter [Lachnospiraceae bacterium]|nr:MATE family efflux transporter [Lachnospiraceae bacterium]
MRTITNEEQYRRMVETPVQKAVISLAIPTTISQLVTVIYNTADTYFVAQIGTSAAAAVGVVFSLMSLIQAAGFGLGMGASSLISRQLGAKQTEEANKIGSSAFFAAVICGTLLMAGGLLSLNHLMRLLGATRTVLPYACSYGFIILLGAPFMCSAFVLNNILRAEGQASLAMWGLCTGGILNMILDPILIWGFKMGISGAALATVLSQLVSFSILLSFFVRKKTIVQLDMRYISRRKHTYMTIIRSGVPTICRQGLGSVASAALNMQASVFGDAALAAMTIANKIYMLVRNLVIGIGQGLQPVAGYNYGAGRKKRVRGAFWFASLLGTAICVAAAGLLFIAAPDVLAWFRHDDSEVIRLGAKALRISCIVMPFLAYSTYVNQIYQCLGFSRPATFLASCRQGIFFIPLVIVLPLFSGFLGVQLSQPAADFCTFLISVPFQIRFFRKHLSETQKEEDKRRKQRENMAS